MQQDENNLELEQELQIEETADESIEIEDSTVEESDESPAETVEDQLKKAQAEAAKFRRLFEKTQKSQPQKETLKPSINKNQVDLSTVQEQILRANGMPDELVKELKAVAKVRGIDMVTAQNDPIFVGIKSNYEKVDREKKASLGASHRSGTVEKKKSFNTPGLSKEEHKALWRESEGN
jgi:hypothetical protein